MVKKWWNDAVVYQIYPKSFMDSNGDGVGDIQGIISKLDYIEALGANVIWLCPINCSPMKDNGYDISDYYQIDPMFGTIEDLERLIAEAKKRQIHILMDLVVNHVSDQHAWFQSAISEENSPYRDFFIIKETKDGKAPNNLRSYFGGSSWERIGETNCYYFHAFGKEQPDLNWENPKLRKEIYEMMQFWIRKGIAGFRVDAIGNLKKSEIALSEGFLSPDGDDGMVGQTPYILGCSGIEVFLSEMRDQVFKPNDCMTVAEINVPHSELEKYIGENGFFSMVFDFSYADIDTNGAKIPCTFTNWTLHDLKKYIAESQEGVQKVGWAAPYLENHDQPRSVFKYLPEKEINLYNTKMLGTLFFFLRGIPYIYQGQEIGMQNYPFQSLEEYDDIDALTKYQCALKCGVSKEDAMEFLRLRSRDNARTPMQWNAEKNGGFSEGEPWLKINPDYRFRNAEQQESDTKSVLHFYKNMIQLRRTSPYKDILRDGFFENIETAEAEDFRYRRVTKDGEVVILINYSKEHRPWNWDFEGYELLLNNYASIDELIMWPWQAVVLGKRTE